MKAILAALSAGLVFCTTMVMCGPLAIMSNEEVPGSYELGDPLPGYTFVEWLQNKRDYAPVALYRSEDGTEERVLKFGLNRDFAQRNIWEAEGYKKLDNHKIFPRFDPPCVYQALPAETPSTRENETFLPDVPPSVLILPYFPGGSIFDGEFHREFPPGQTHQKVLDLITHFTRRLAVMHDAGIVFGSIKPGNIVYDRKNDLLTLIDREHVSDKLISQRLPGGSQFRSPQADLSEVADYDVRKEDVFATATTLLWILTGKFAKFENVGEEIHKVIHKTAYQTIFSAMMKYDPAARLSMKVAADYMGACHELGHLAPVRL